MPGTIRIGQGKLAGGAYTYLHLDQPIPSPCGGDPVQDVLLWNSSIGDPMMLRAYAGQHLVVHGEFDCPVSGIQFAPDSGTTP